MKRLFLHTLLILSLSSCHSCKTENTTPSALPPETDTGAATFGCMVDNKAFLPHKHAFATGKSFECRFNRYDTGGGWLSIHASNDKDDMRIWMQLDSISLRTGQLYMLGNRNARMWVDKASTYYVGRVNAAVGGLLVSRYDSTERILAGTFWFDGIDTVSHTLLQVRQGRFDTHFY